MAKLRTIHKVIKGVLASDGDGVQLTRIIGTAELDMLDPFLLLDAFGSDQPQDYIGGFPSHPHRGFETVTYMLDGKMRHKDSAGNEGVIESGGVQWMTAGSGIIHSEMPEQTHGLLAGFQLWVNLPASEKMSRPKYQEFTSDEIQVEKRTEPGGIATLRVVAGTTKNSTEGVIVNDTINPLYWDIEVAAANDFSDSIALGHNAFIYVISGKIEIENQRLNFAELGILTDGDEIRIKAEEDSRFLLIAGKPFNEPVSRGGPFVMNTTAEIQQAFADYRNAALVQ